MTYVTWAPSLASLATEPPAENSGSSGCAETTSTRSYLSGLDLGLAVVFRFVVCEVFFVATAMRVRDARRGLPQRRLPELWLPRLAAPTGHAGACPCSPAKPGSKTVRL